MKTKLPKLMMIAMTLLSIPAFAEEQKYFFNWDTDRLGFLRCYPADRYGNTLNGSYPVDSKYCADREIHGYWGESVGGQTLCYPKVDSDSWFDDRAKQPIDNSYCADAYAD